MPRDPNAQSLLNRISKLEAALGMVAGGQQIASGNGAPTFAAASGSLYLRRDGSANNRLYINTGGSSWSALTTG
jgi:hypothetical protein